MNNDNENRLTRPAITLLLFALFGFFAIYNHPIYFAPPIPGWRPGVTTERGAEKQNGTGVNEVPFEFPRYQPQPIDNDPRTQGMFGPGNEPDPRIGPMPFRTDPAYHPLNKPKE